MDLSIADLDRLPVPLILEAAAVVALREVSRERAEFERIARAHRDQAVRKHLTG